MTSSVLSNPMLPPNPTMADRARFWVRHFEAVFEDVTGRAPTQASLHVALAVAFYESGLGGAWVSRRIYDRLVDLDYVADDFETWASAVRRATNLGATQYKRPQDFGPGPWPAESPDGNGFLYMDTNPDDQGLSHPYAMYFRARFSGTPEEVARDYLRILYVIHGRSSVLDEAEAGDLYGVSTQLRSTSYYAGFGRTQDERIANHFRAVSRGAVEIARFFNWPMPDGTELPPPSIRLGDMGPVVLDAQERLAVLGYYTGDLDGDFGPKTERAVKAFQRDHGLTPDGIAGQLTWTALRADRPETEEPSAPTDQVDTGETPTPTDPIPPSEMEEPMLRWFAHAHLPNHLKAPSRIVGDAAHELVRLLPRSAERTVALRKLLEGKDAAVRAAVDAQ